MFRTVILMLGGNIGDSEAIFEVAKVLINNRIGIIAAQSALYRTAPWGEQEQQFFLNQAIKVNTSLEPIKLMSESSAIEKGLDKKTEYLNGPRTIDIDIMFYDDLIIDSLDLTIPHPRLHLRRFNLMPISELVPDLVHPVLHQSITELLLNCSDPLEVSVLNQRIKP